MWRWGAPFSAPTSPASSMPRWIRSPDASVHRNSAFPRPMANWNSDPDILLMSFFCTPPPAPVQSRSNQKIKGAIMDIKKRDFLSLAAGVGAVAGLAGAASEAAAQPRRPHLAGPIDGHQRRMAHQNGHP